MQAKTVRTAVIFGAPVAFLISGAVPPTQTGFNAAHLVGVIAMALGLWLLTSGVKGGLAVFARVAVLPFVILAGAGLPMAMDAWVVAGFAAVLARRGDSPLGATILMLTGVVILAVGRPVPGGIVGTSALLTGLAWLHMDLAEQAELRQAEANKRAVTSATALQLESKQA